MNSASSGKSLEIELKHTCMNASSRVCRGQDRVEGHVQGTRRQLLNLRKALSFRFCSRTNRAFHTKCSGPALNTWIFLGGKHYFLYFVFPQVSMKFTAGSKTRPELCFHKHIISTNRIIQKHIIITHIRSSALWIQRFLVPFQTSLVSAYKPQCVYQDPTQHLAHGGKSGQISRLTPWKVC